MNSVFVRTVRAGVCEPAHPGIRVPGWYGRALVYEVRGCPAGLHAAAVARIMAVTAVHGGNVVDYADIGPGRVVRGSRVPFTRPVAGEHRRR